MFPKKQLSGFQKRKLKTDRETNSAKSLKIDTFFCKPNPIESSKSFAEIVKVSPDLNNSVNQSQSVLESSSFASDIIEPHVCPGTNNYNASANTLDAATLVVEDPAISTHDDADASFESQSDPSEQMLNVDLCITKHPTDRVNFPINVLDSATKHFIVSHESCRPKGPYPKDTFQSHRSFSESYYKNTTVSGLQFERSWLCYSPQLNKVYCEHCWLFADRSSHHYQDVWSDGYSDWKHLSTAITKHEKSTVHLDACIVYEQWRLRGTLDNELQSQIDQEKHFWRQVLHRMLNVTLTIGMCGIAFRGHVETAGTPENRGNFLSIIDLLAQYDPVLEQLIHLPKGSIKYMSPLIQNELIQTLAQKVEHEIINDIKTAPFFSILMDTTQDISKTDQLSQVFRYVSITKNKEGVPTELKINESFLGFEEVADQSAQELEHLITHCVESKGLSLSKCRGQGYDGASVMSGIYTGVQARLREKEPSAVYVHCASHNLNLVINDAVKGIPEINSFFETVQTVYIYFGQSINRWGILQSLLTEEGSANAKITLKKLNPTRWAGRYDAIFALKIRYIDVLKCLSRILLESKKNDEKQEARNIQKQLENFNFVFLLILQTKILQNINLVSKSLQSKQVDLSRCSQLLENALEELVTYRDEFSSAREEAVALAKRWNVPQEFDKKRVKTVKRHFDELSEDHRLVNPEERFKIQVFNSSLDIVINQISNRFHGLREVVETFQVLEPKYLSTTSDAELLKVSMTFTQKFKKDLSPMFPSQLLAMRSALRKEIAQLNNVKDLATLLIVNNSSLSVSFPDVCSACVLFLTIPVTVASAERTFSKLKLIKTYLRSTMTQERLKGLAILSIEQERARKVNFDEVIDIFAEQKARRKSFK